MQPILPLVIAGLVLAGVTVASASAAPFPVTSFQADPTGVTVRLNPGTLRLEVCDDRIIHVTYSPTESLPDKVEFVVTRDWTPVPFEVKEEQERLVLSTARMAVAVDRASGAVTFLDGAGQVLLQEPAEGGKSVTPRDGAADELVQVQQVFLSPADEHLYGLAQAQDGVWNWRGMPIQLRQVNTQAAFPVMISSRGYGLLWDNASLTDFNFVDQEIPLASGDEAVDANAPRATEQLREADRAAGPARGNRTGTFTTGEAGEYVFFAKDGDRRGEIGIVVNGQTLAHIRNLWVPYTIAGTMTLPANTECTVQLLGGGKDARLFARPVGNTTTFRSHAAKAIDYYFFYGPDLDDVVAQYRTATGAAPLWPKWAYGFWQCRERYSSQQQILDTAAEFRKRQIPIDLIVQDWQYWGPHGWGAYQWDESQYPDPAAMIQALHERNIHFMISVWSNPKGTAGDALRSSGGMIEGTEWVDAFSPAARELRWSLLNDAFFSKGVDAWWQDATEPGDDGNSVAGHQVWLGSGDLYRNAYPLFANQAVYEGQRATDPDKRVCILTRSAFPGIQRYGAALWSGDIGGNWEAFARQIPAGLHMTLAGLPYWTTDCGGFFRPRDQHESEDYAELLTRWFQYSTFCPIQRIHGYQSETEIWKYPLAADTMVDYLHLRYRLLPYIYSLAWRVTDRGDTMMRALPLDFRTDPQACAVADQYMFGPVLLVSPVTEAGATTRRVYLPAGTTWTNFWTGETQQGGQTVNADAPRQIIPLFVRAGSILPMGPDLQYTSEKPADPIELRIYRGADGEFILYEDEGDSYRYEKGAFATIPICWDEAAGTLTIGERRGVFPGMLTVRTFRIVWVRPGQGIGPELSADVDAEVRYTGEILEVQAPRS